MEIKSEIMWSIWHPKSGFIYGTTADTRKVAIDRLIEGTEVKWENCYRAGYRAMKVIISAANEGEQ